jgi:hypothetical protein
MRTTAIAAVAAMLAASLLPACSSMGRSAGEPEIPANAVEATRTLDNGDVVSEYRVAGQLRAVKVQPKRGPTYYLIDRNGDGRMDPSRGDVDPVYYRIYSW